MGETRKRIGIIGYEGVNAVDVVGPLEVLATASRSSNNRRHPEGLYETVVIGTGCGPFRAESGVRFVPDLTLDEAPALDTVIVPGGYGLREPATNQAVSSWLGNHAAGIRRICTVCTGIYGLAPTGLLDGRSVTTHWRFADDVGRRFPALRVQDNALFLKDGRFYTSGGVTAAIDLTLALVEEDLGLRTALDVARELVAYVKRPGGQEQYSEPLQMQTRLAARGQDGFADLVAWILGHLQQDLSVEALAERAAFSPRHFSRRFTAALGCTPAEFVENARLAQARERLTASRRSIDTIAASVGFHSADVFRRRFLSRFGLSPRSYRERFAASHFPNEKLIREVP